MLKWRNWLHLGERGDTIVEVLIAIGVVSVVLGGAYVTTNKSLQGTRAAEERGNAIKLVEAQLEQLKGLMATDPAAIDAAPTNFCLYVVSGKPTVFNATNANCRLSTAGIPTSNEPVFNLSISHGGTPTTQDTYTIINRWNSIKNKGQDQVQMVYRIYP